MYAMVWVCATSLEPSQASESVAEAQLKSATNIASMVSHLVKLAGATTTDFKVSLSIEGSLGEMLDGSCRIEDPTVGVDWILDSAYKKNLQRNPFYDQFLPSISVGQAGSVFSTVYTKRDGIDWALMTTPPGKPVPIEISGDKMGTLHFDLHSITAFTQPPSKEGGTRVVPFLCELTSKSMIQNPACYGLVWQDSESKEWKYRLAVIPKSANHDATKMLYDIAQPDLDPKCFFPDHCFSDSEVDRAARLKELATLSPLLQQMAERVEESKSQDSRDTNVVGFPDQPLFLIEGSLTDFKQKKKFLGRSVMIPMDTVISAPKSLSAPNELRNTLSLHFRDNHFVHFAYQDFKRGQDIKNMSLDFFVQSRNGTLQPQAGSARLDLREGSKDPISWTFNLLPSLLFRAAAPEMPSSYSLSINK